MTTKGEFRDKLFRWCNECGVYSSEAETTDTILGGVLSRAGFRKTKDSNRGGHTRVRLLYVYK